MAHGGAGETSTTLHKAARSRSEVEVARFLSEGADVAAQDGEGRTALHLAVMRGHTGIIQRLLPQGGAGVLLSRDVLGCTPVHLAAVQNQIRLVLLLIKPLLEDKEGCTLLHEIAKRGCIQDFISFLHLGWGTAAPSEMSSEPQEAEDILCIPNFDKMSQILGWSELHYAAMEGRVSTIEGLIETCSCDVHLASANSWTPLHYAAAYNQVEAIETLVRLGAKIDCQNSAGSTPLHIACGEGHMSAVQKLIDLGCSLAVKDQDGCVALYCAAAWNQIEVVRYLHSLGCALRVQTKEGRTALHIAAEQGWAELIEVLVEELGSAVDCRDAYGFTPLHCAANWGWIDSIQKLVELAHHINVQDLLGRTPLHYAALHGRAEAIERLCRLGADPQQADQRGGNTPLHLAADAGQWEAVAMLVELGADLEARTSNGLTCLQLATLKGIANVDVLGLLVGLGSDISPPSHDMSLETPLHIAARAGQLDTVRSLIKSGANVYEKTKDGSSPLHYAAAFGQAHVLEELIKAGNHVEPLDNALNTPLHLAAGCGFLNAVLVLIRLGGNLNCRDMSDCTPLQNAAHGTYSSFAKVSPGLGQYPKEQHQGLETLSLRRSNLSSPLLPENFAGDKDGGMVPVRTGFAWATLGRPNPSWNGTELMSLLRKITRSQGFGGLLNRSCLVQNVKLEEMSKYKGPLGAGEHHDFFEDREGLDLLLKKLETFHLEHMEQDRSRLLPVAEAMVQMGADIAAVDNEGRTALHLAAGCGDKAMVVKLVELGSDVNCKDGVGGTPLHHAAMANKKEVMFALARLGADWRAKAEGIDGATASLVLCGQHGKSARQQKLLEAKLKRVFMNGELAWRNGKSPFDIGIDVEEDDKQEEDWEDLAERADANMAALLEEEAKAIAPGRKRKKKNRRRGKQAENFEEAAVCSISSVVSHSDKMVKGHALDCSKSIGKTPKPRTDSRLLDTAYHEKCNSGACEHGSYQDVRVFLDEAILCANTVLEIGAAAGGETMRDVLAKLDNALQQANQAGIGTKHGRKVRNRLQALLSQSTSNNHSGDMHEFDSKTSAYTACGVTTTGWKLTNGIGGNKKQPSVKDGSLAHQCQEFEWKQVGSHGKKDGSAVPLSKNPQGSRSSQNTSGHHSRWPSQLTRSDSRTMKSSTIAVAKGSVVVRTGNVVVVKTVAALNESTKPSSGNQDCQKHLPDYATNAAPKPTKPVWKHGSKHKSTSNSPNASDPNFPPLQASTSGSSANQDTRVHPGDTLALEPEGSNIKEKSADTGKNSSRADLKPYQLFGGDGTLQAPAGLPGASAFGHSRHSFAWTAQENANSSMCGMETQQHIEDMSDGDKHTLGCSHPLDPTGAYIGDPADNSESRGIPIPAPTHPYHMQQGPYYGNGALNRMEELGPGQPCMWHAPMPFAQPVGYMPLMSSSLDIQAMNRVVGPYGLLPHVPNMFNQSMSYDSMLHPHRFQPPPPPGPPPQMQSAFSTYEQGCPVACGHVDAVGGPDFRDRLGADGVHQREENLEHVEFMELEESPEAPLTVSRHLLGELESEIGI